MSYKKSFREASFRKVKFIWADESTEGGNNLNDDGRPKLVKEQNSKKKKSSFVVSDKKKRFTLEGFVKGINYHLDRDALINALEKDGPGELVHPLYGSVRVVVESWTKREGLSNGLGIATFSMTFCESGKVFLPKNKDDSQEKLKANASNARAIAEGDFAKDFSVKGKPQFVKDSAIDTFSKIQKKTLESISQIKSQSASVADSVFTLRKNIASAKDFVEEPIGLAANLRGSYDLMRGVSLNPKDLFSAYKKNKDYQKDLKAVVPSTTSRIVEKKNQDSFVTFTNTLTATHKSELIIEAMQSEQFESKDELIQERNNLIKEIEEILETTTNDELFMVMNAIKVSIVKLVPGESFAPQNVKRINVSNPTNTLALAFDIFQDEEKEKEILSKNKIINPLMIMPLTEIEVNIE